MLVSRRKRKEPKAMKVYLNNKTLEQVTTMKYLGIIIDYITHNVRCRKMYEIDS
jgi:ATP-dependent Clp protease adapter protein ClpS